MQQIMIYWKTKSMHTWEHPNVKATTLAFCNDSSADQPISSCESLQSTLSNVTSFEDLQHFSSISFCYRTKEINRGSDRIQVKQMQGLHIRMLNSLKRNRIYLELRVPQLTTTTVNFKRKPVLKLDISTATDEIRFYGHFLAGSGYPA